MTTEKTRKQAERMLRFGTRMRDHMLASFVQARDMAEGELADTLSPPQIHMLMQIKKQGSSITISELAHLLEVSPPSASTMVDRLVEKNALVRERSEKDRRVVVVQLSPLAIQFTEMVESFLLSGFMNIIDKIGPELTEDWCNVIDRVEKVLQEEQ
jgi:DNA-binding MarR family transcriptional regulator